MGYTLDSGETLMFIKNIQGDVIALVDETGRVKVEYQYDSWGKVTCIPKNGVTQGHADYFALISPITYRGYNYDVSTGLYYLQSRYYNPEWGRFLNCDDTNILLSTQGENHGANLFAYCENNPVNRVDYCGNSSTTITLGFLLIYIIVPVIDMIETLEKYGCGDIVEHDDITAWLTLDKYGLMHYTFRVNVIDNFVAQDYYLFSYIFGSYSNWNGLISDMEKSNALSIISSPITGIVASLVTGSLISKIAPPAGLVIDFAGVVISDFVSNEISNINEFKSSSRAVLNTAKEYNPSSYTNLIFGYLGSVTYYTRYLDYKSNFKRFRGEKCIHALGG